MIFRTSNQISRVPEGMYADMEAAVIRLTGLEQGQAWCVVDSILGPLHLAPNAEWTEEETPCGHAFWTYEGVWRICLEEGEHDRHLDVEAYSWKTGEARDVDLREFGK